MKSFRLLLIIIIHCLSVPIFTQNLIRNPSFEELSDCPGIGKLTYAIGWDSIRTVDLLNYCMTNPWFFIGANNEIVTPLTNNIPYDGNSFMCLYSSRDGTWREMAINELVNPLEKKNIVLVFIKLGLQNLH